jgi:DNA-binding NtrC family response regulator
MLEGICLTVPPGQPAIRAEDVRGWIRQRHQASPVGATRGPTLQLHDLERWAISEAMRQTAGNMRQAAQLLGISRDTLYRKLHELGVDVDMSDSCCRPRTPAP